ncbi:hypothetical protein QTO34_010533 [Cnephaeus nilssonii]|uniref:DNA helicase Pif1-like 2B domain-containing protein n=1 Tax=Cnephaeus nilssonii TaxID=3371016 RepID=A0AA40LFW9_CNENI|nr:hypothetical protein QTO34_010533 [Eptesicus nilssonii]
MPTSNDLHKLRASHRQEGHLGLCRHSLGQQCLSTARRSEQKCTLWNFGTKLKEALWALQKQQIMSPEYHGSRVQVHFHHVALRYHLDPLHLAFGQHLVDKVIPGNVAPAGAKCIQQAHDHGDDEQCAQPLTTLKLTRNMRVQLQNDRSAEIFSHQLLEIGNGKVPVDLTSGQISLPRKFCNLVTSKEELVEKVFPNIQTNYKNHNWLSERAILAAKNKDIYELNNILQSNIQSEAITYKSVDTVVEADEAVNYPTEFLNSLDPPHVLQLKIGMPIIMLRNINQPKLCNSTRLEIKKINEEPWLVWLRG